MNFSVPAYHVHGLLKTIQNLKVRATLCTEGVGFRPTSADWTERRAIPVQSWLPDEDR